jgi:hypothetical protein
MAAIRNRDRRDQPNQVSTAFSGTPQRRSEPAPEFPEALGKCVSLRGSELTCSYGIS